MPPYRVKLTAEFEKQLDSWIDVPPGIVRTLCHSLVDILEHQSAFSQLRAVPGGQLLNIDVEPYAFVILVTHRDETFFVHRFTIDPDS